MKDGDGKFSEMTPCEGVCRSCKERELSYREWESSCGGYVDYQYACRVCGHSWWVDGIDS
jgi:hypothetical protein